jgi:hypothetical protein
MATRMCVRGNAERQVHGVAFVLSAVAIFFAGCASQQQPDVQAKEDKAALQEAAKEIGSIDDARCQSFGFQPGSSGYTKCRKELDSERNHMGIKE